MIKKFTFLIIILAIIILLVASNPSKDEFVEWFTIQIEKDANSLTEILSKTIGRPLINAYTTRNDYTIFSFYTLTSPEEEIKYLGLFKQFIKIK